MSSTVLIAILVVLALGGVVMIVQLRGANKAPVEPAPRPAPPAMPGTVATPEPGPAPPANLPDAAAIDPTAAPAEPPAAAAAPVDSTTPEPQKTASPPTSTLKGLGPKVAARLAELGVTTVADLAALSDEQANALDAQLGAFQGRMARDRWIEQARLLNAGDIAGFEAAFGKLGG